MAWTYAMLKAALAALSPQPANHADAAAAINAQAATLSNQPFTVYAAKLVAQTSANMSWAKILQRAEATAQVPPVTAIDRAILAARTLVSLSDSQLVDPGSAQVWTTWLQGLADLQAVGDLTAADTAAITALTGAVVAAWQPAVTAGDVQTAKAQP